MCSQEAELTVKTVDGIKAVSILKDHIDWRVVYLLQGPGVTFGPKGIKRHIHVLDCLNERRRRVHKGHDNEMVILKVQVCDL